MYEYKVGYTPIVGDANSFGWACLIKKSYLVSLNSLSTGKLAEQCKEKHIELRFSKF